MLEEKETGWPELLQKQGLTFKSGDTRLEGQAYEFMTGHDTIVSMGVDMELAVVWKGMGEPMISQCGKVKLGSRQLLFY